MNKITRAASSSKFIVAVILLLNTHCGLAQVASHLQTMYFISDFQAPMAAEKIISKYYRNEEARDSLFTDIIRQSPKNVFLLGDMTSKGSKEEAWIPLETFLFSLQKTNTAVHAIPGNHEYMGKSAGTRLFLQRFPEKWLHGYLVAIDSVVIVMLNSNFKAIGKTETAKQLSWYKTALDSLDKAPGVKAIIVCTHHAPYSNSTIVGSSIPVAEKIVPVFEQSKKSKLFISGHSHNLEYFPGVNGKHFLVIGGGGGIAQPLVPPDQSIHHDLLDQDKKPLYFYLVIEKDGNQLKLTVKGFKRDFIFFESAIGSITIDRN